MGNKNHSNGNTVTITVRSVFPQGQPATYGPQPDLPMVGRTAAGAPPPPPTSTTAAVTVTVVLPDSVINSISPCLPVSPPTRTAANGIHRILFQAWGV